MILSPLPVQKFFDNNGNPLVGGLLFTYQAGTTTPIATYQDSGGGSPNTNPVVLNFRGEANVWLDISATYKFVLSPSTDTDPPTNPIWTVDNIVVPISLTDITQQFIGQLLWPRTDAEINANITPVNYAYETSPALSVLRYAGIVADGATDCTTALLAAMNAIGSGLFVIPYNVKYDRPTLMATLDTSVLILDLSQINDFSAPGETTKHIGIVSSDEAVNDTHWNIDSAHHPVVALNNYGTAGSISAASRLATIIWNAGQFSLGAANKLGYRSCALQQFAKSSSGDFWIWHIRSLAPWVSIDGQYEEWASGQVIASTGIYRSSSVGQYVSASAGTTGATEPTWTSGTMSDGGVDWTYLDSIDRTIISIDQYNRMLIGAGSFTYTFEHQVGLTDPNGNYAARWVARGVSKTAEHRLVPTDSGSNQVDMPFFRAQDTVGLRLMNAAASTDLIRFDANGTSVKQLQLLSATAADADTTPSVAGISTLYLTNTGATSITALDGGIDDQLVVLIATNANTTLISSSTLLLTGSANQALTAFSSVSFKKVPAGISDRWIEIARSIK